jgi:hypothetical protein
MFWPITVAIDWYSGILGLRIIRNNPRHRGCVDDTALSLGEHRVAKFRAVTHRLELNLVFPPQLRRTEARP